MSMRVADSQSYLTDAERGGCWSKKSGLEQKLIIFSAFLGVACLGLIIGLAVAVGKTNPDSETTSSTPIPTSTASSPPTISTSPNTETSYTNTATSDPITPHSELCDSPQCKSTAAFYTGNMNISIDPCDDFYGFVCGGWESKKEIPDDKSRWGVFDELRVNLATTCIKELRDVIINDETPRDSFYNARKMFKTCVNTDSVPKEVFERQLKSLLQEISGGEIIISTNPTVVTSTTDSATTDATEKSWTDIMTTASNKFGLSFIITIQIGADIKNTEENIIYIDQQNTFPVGRLTLINETTESDHDKIKAYKKYIAASACFLQNKFCADPLVTPESQAVEDIIEFEKFLAQHTRDPVSRRDANTWYNPMTIDELQTNISDIATLPKQFNVLELIKANLEGSGVTVNETTTVIVKELDYLKKVLARMDEYTEQAKNYMRTRTVQAVGPYLYKEFREHEFEFDKEVSGAQNQTSLEEKCFDLVNGHFDHVVGRLYVDAVNFTEETKQDMIGMVKNLANAFRVLVKNNDWMDNSTKEAASLKLGVMNEKIGFPDWTMDDQKLNEYYQMDNLTDDSYDNLKQVYSFSVQKTLEKLIKGNNRTTDWVSSASIVNAFYSPSANGITFPAGILQIPFYQEKRLNALNYGAIGYVIGHEITHGYDDQGRQYDANGNFENWWSEDTLTKFNQKKQCFIDQYSNIKDELTGLNLKGDQYIGENIADNGGIRESYEAYMNYAREEARLPGLENLDDRQLFFIGAGSVWCTKFRKQALEQQINYGVHSPGMYRATVPLMNTKQFAEVFNCPKGSEMNPDDKCQIW